MLSYVIQNFYRPSRSLIKTNRLKLIISYNNIFALYTFYQFNVIVHKYATTLKFETINYFKFFKTFFMKRALFIEKYFSITLPDFMWTKFHKSLRVSSLILLLTLVNKKIGFFNPVLVTNFCSSSVYYLPLRLVFFSRYKKLYKSIFLTFFLMSIQLWPCWFRYYMPSSSCLYISTNFYLVYFVNKKYFKVQRF